MLLIGNLFHIKSERNLHLYKKGSFNKVYSPTAHVLLYVKMAKGE